MTQWICYNCGSTNDISNRICQGEGKKKNDPYAPGGKCFHKRQNLDKVIGEEDVKED